MDHTKPSHDGTPEPNTSFSSILLAAHTSPQYSNLPLSGDEVNVPFNRTRASEYADRQDAVQTLGGRGYLKDYGLEMRLRAVKTLQCLTGAHALAVRGKNF